MQIGSHLARIQRVASQLTPQRIAQEGIFLGAGLAGGSYQVDLDGESYVAKQVGHQQSIAGQFQSWNPSERQIQAAKQVAVHNALAMAGYPFPAAALLEGHGDWLVMQKVEGQSLKDLDPQDVGPASQLAREVSDQMEPLVKQVLDRMALEYPGKETFFTCNMDVVGNTFFVRDEQGLRISGMFDPIV